ncbi:hypothetical protein Tco_1271483, partial [Tanacetum coccineum]
MEDEIFFNQSKYIKEMLKKFGLEDSKPTKTSMSTEIKLTKDDEADSVDSSKYRGMIGSLLYLTASRPDIIFSVCLCARFEENPKTSHLEAVKRIFRYIRGTSHLGLWYPKGTEIEIVVYADSDHAGDYVDRKSTSSVCTKMPSEYQQDYKKTRAYAPKIYNDPNMSDTLRDIYRTLESRYVHEGRTIDPSFYNDLSDDSVAKFTAIGFDFLLSLDEQICPRRTVHEKIDKEGNTIYKLPNQIETNEIFDHLRPCKLVIRENIYPAIGNRDHTQAVIALMLYCLENRQPFNLAYFIIRRMYFFKDRQDKVLPYDMILTRLFKNLKANMAQGSFDERYKLVPRKISSLKAKQPKKPPQKRTRNVGKSKRTQLSTSSSTKSLPSDNEDLPRSYSRALKDDPNMSKEQREIRGMFKNLGRALHNFARMLKKG